MACAAHVQNNDWTAERARQAISIEQALDSPDVNEADKAKLRLVQEMRHFAVTQLRLAKTANYTTYLPGDSDEVPMWVLIVASREDFKPVTWRYGSKDVPYRTYADAAQAQADERKYRRRGYETYLRPAYGYSSQGSVADPVMPYMLQLKTDELTSMIIHELTHATVASDASPYEEGCATFVGLHGAKAFLDWRFGPENPHSRRLIDMAADRSVFEKFLRDVAERLVRLHEQKPDDLQAKRNELFVDARRRYDELRPQMRTAAFRGAPIHRLNAAMLFAFLNYAETAPFADAFDAVGQNWPKFIEMTRLAAKHAEPFDELQRLTRPSDR